MAHTKSGGSTALGRDSESKRLGVKRSDGMLVRPGMIIVRQRGTPIQAGISVARGSDDTLFATASGKIKFRTRKIKNFQGKLTQRVIVDVVSVA